jgi:multiple antibiotic resistance protein
MPILAGPGTIATAMNFATTGGFNETLVTIVSFGVLCIVTYLLFLFGDRIVKAVGPSALSVVTKMMGLILAVIGVQMLLEGIAEAIKTGFF